MLVDEIKKIISGDAAADEKTRDEYSRDYSIFAIKPEMAVFPRSALDVSNLVRFVNDRKKKNPGLSLTGRSGGTDMTGGPLTQSIVVVFSKYLNRVKEIGDNFAIVEPGVYFRDFERELKTHGLLFPPYPASKDICALGGMIANNAGGEKTLAYGKVEDFVEELKVVLSDANEYVFKPLNKKELDAKRRLKNFEGEIYRKIFKIVDANYDLLRKAKPKVSKNSAGYFLWNVWDKNTFDLTKLFVGSQGTLGLVTEAKLRLVRQKKFSRLAVVFLNDLNPLADLIVELLRIQPESLESYDDKTLRLALRFLPGIIKAMKGNALKLFWQFLPEFAMVARGGLPKMVILVGLVSDDEKDLGRRLDSFKDIVARFKLQSRITKNDLEAEKYFTIRRQSFKLLHSHATDKETAPFIDDFIVEPRYLPEFLPQLNKILEPYGDKMIYTIAGHPGNGNFHIIPLMDLKDEKVRALIPKISDAVYDLVLKYGGSITAEHNDGLIRGPYLEKMYGREVYRLFEEVKNVFDPLNIFNPRKKIGVSLDYVMGLIKK